METLLPNKNDDDDDEDEDDDHEIDAYEIGIAETYHRLWSVVKLPAVQSLILILLTYRLPCALSDNVKFLKAVEFGLSKQTTALLSPTIILPLGILVPIIGTNIWHGHPLKQFMFAYKFRVTFVAWEGKQHQESSFGVFLLPRLPSRPLFTVYNSMHR